MSVEATTDKNLTIVDSRHLEDVSRTAQERAIRVHLAHQGRVEKTSAAMMD